MPYGTPGVPGQPSTTGFEPDAALREAQRLLDAGMPFHAHEVLEDTWKSAPDEQRLLWKSLAQLAVGITHALRGNRAGAAALIHRGAEGLPQGELPHKIDGGSVRIWARQSLAVLMTHVESPQLAPLRLLRAPEHGPAQAQIGWVGARMQARPEAAD